MCDLTPINRTNTSYSSCYANNKRTPSALKKSKGKNASSWRWLRHVRADVSLGLDVKFNLHELRHITLYQRAFFLSLQFFVLQRSLSVFLRTKCYPSLFMHLICRIVWPLQYKSKDVQVQRSGGGVRSIN